jgi:O-antigen ligase
MPLMARDSAIAGLAAPSTRWSLPWLERLGQWLLLALPLVFVLGRSPADVLISLLALLFLLRSATTGGWRWLKTPWVLAGLGFWLYLLGQSAFAVEPGDAYGRALPFCRFVLFAAALQHWLLAEERQRWRFLISLALAVGFVALDCLYQYATGADLFGNVPEGKFRLSGPFENDVAGTFMAKTGLPLIGALIVLALARGRRAWLWGGLLAAALAAVVLLTGERTAFATFGMGLLVMALAIRAIRLPWLLIGMLGLGLVTAAITGNGELKERFVGHTSADLQDFWSGRYGIIFVKAWEVFEEEPAFGVGLKNFRQTCETPNFAHKGPVESWCFTHPHNPYMELLAETGAIGLLAFLALMALAGRDIAGGWRRDRADHALLVGASAALLLFLFPFMVSKSIFSNWNAILFWTALGLALAIARPRPSGPADSGEPA